MFYDWWAAFHFARFSVRYCGWEKAYVFRDETGHWVATYVLERWKHRPALLHRGCVRKSADQ